MVIASSKIRWSDHSEQARKVLTRVQLFSKSKKYLKRALFPFSNGEIPQENILIEPNGDSPIKDKTSVDVVNGDNIV